MNLSQCYSELEQSLAGSTASDRKKWAAVIIREGFSLKDLASLLLGERKTSLRFQWLLTEVGIMDPETLYNALPFLLDLSATVDQNDFTTAFATYWSVVGVPGENEAQALELLFGWLSSPNANITLKKRSLSVLHTFTAKYPELEGELAAHLENQDDTIYLKRKGNSQP